MRAGPSAGPVGRSNSVSEGTRYDSLANRNPQETGSRPSAPAGNRVPGNTGHTGSRPAGNAGSTGARTAAVAAAGGGSKGNSAEGESSTEILKTGTQH